MAAQIPPYIYQQILETKDYEDSRRLVGTLWQIGGALRSRLRRQLSEANKNRYRWHKNTRKFKKFLEDNKKIITDIHVDDGEMNFIFIIERCQKITIKTQTGEFKFSISFDFAETLCNQGYADERSVATKFNQGKPS